MKIITTLITILLLTISTFSIEIIAPNLIAPENDKVTVEIAVGGAEGIVACDYILDYDPDVLTPVGDRRTNFSCETGWLAVPMQTLCNVVPGEEGILRVATWGYTNYTGTGSILTVTFYTHEKGVSPLEFDAIRMFDAGGLVEINEKNGWVEVR